MPACSRWESSTRRALAPSDQEDRVDPSVPPDLAASIEYGDLRGHDDPWIRRWERLSTPLRRIALGEHLHHLFSRQQGLSRTPQGNGWNTANNILAKAKKAGKTIAVGDKYIPMGGPMTYGSVGHNWATPKTPPSPLQVQRPQRSLHARHRPLANRTQNPNRQHLQATRSSS